MMAIVWKFSETSLIGVILIQNILVTFEDLKLLIRFDTGEMIHLHVEIVISTVVIFLCELFFVWNKKFMAKMKITSMHVWHHIHNVWSLWICNLWQKGYIFVWPWHCEGGMTQDNLHAKHWYWLEPQSNSLKYIIADVIGKLYKQNKVMICLGGLYKWVLRLLDNIRTSW